MRILAVDPGEKRLGLAISDPTGTIARPLKILEHIARQVDAQTIAQIAAAEEVGLIIIGQALDIEGKPSFEGRRAARLAGAIRSQTEIPVELWDESESTQTARMAQHSQGLSKKRRQRPIDDLAAAVILQSYIDGHSL
jgi:putative Holliday junction resolvase